MLLEKVNKLSIILGSQSPRREELLRSLDLNFKIIIKSVDESIPSTVSPENAAEYIALKKINAFDIQEFEGNLIITADTVVVDLDGNVLGKPNDAEEAISVLKRLSASTHYVYTGVAVLYNKEILSFTSKTEVVFTELSTDEIVYYVDKFKPFDKAGSYGIQEWIGRIGVEKIVGTFENVMGLPTSRLYKELSEIEKGL